MALLCNDNELTDNNTECAIPLKVFDANVVGVVSCLEKKGKFTSFKLGSISTCLLKCDTPDWLTDGVTIEIDTGLMTITLIQDNNNGAISSQTK